MTEAEIEEWLRIAYDDEEREGFGRLKQSLLSPVEEGRRGVFRTLRPVHVAQAIAHPFDVMLDDALGIERLDVLRWQLQRFFEVECEGQVLPVPRASAFRRALGDGARLGAAVWPVVAYLHSVVALDDDALLTVDARLEAKHQHWLEAMCMLNLRTRGHEGDAAFVDAVRRVVRRLRAESNFERASEDEEDEMVAQACHKLIERERSVGDSLLQREPASRELGVDGARMVIAYWREVVRNAVRDVPDGGLLGALSPENPHVEAGDYQSSFQPPIPPSTLRKLAAEQRSLDDGSLGPDEKSIEEISNERAARQSHDPGPGRVRVNAIVKETRRSWETVDKALKRAVEFHGEAPPKDEMGYLLDETWQARVKEQLGRARRRPTSPRTQPRRTVADAAELVNQPIAEVLSKLQELHNHDAPAAEDIDPAAHDVGDDEMLALQEYYRQFSR